MSKSRNFRLRFFFRQPSDLYFSFFLWLFWTWCEK